MSHEEPYVTEDGRLGFAVRLTPEDLADIRMAGEMFDASPDGQAEAARRRELLDSLPTGTIEISGEWDQS